MFLKYDLERGGVMCSMYNSRESALRNNPGLLNNETGFVWFKRWAVW